MSAKQSIFKWASSADGEFRRQLSSFRNLISKEPGSLFTPEAGRYHLYISHACPWAHRTVIVRKLKGLDSIIGLSVVHYRLGEGGWHFAEEGEVEGAIPDTVNGFKHLSELYFAANPEYKGRFTVPVLWDTKHRTIVNNESSEIIRMLNHAFDDLVPQETRTIDFYPSHLRKEIDALNEWIYPTVNDGVYKSGFATTQAAYEKNVVPLFDSLDRIEGILSTNTFLTGNDFTEADIRLFTTVLRFDPVYHGHFKCNIKSIGHDYPHILDWMRVIFHMPGVKETVNMYHIKHHYYESHIQINPTRVVPLGNGPDLDVEPIRKAASAKL